MKGCYIHYRDIRSRESTMVGSDKKVAGQISAFNKTGLNCEFLFCPHPETIPGMIRSSLPFLSDGVAWPDPLSLADADYLYIRKPRFFSKDFIAFLKKLKTINPQILVICEIPTYPYDKEMMRPRTLPAFQKDKKYRTRLEGLVDYFADLSNHQCIFGLPTLPFFNGVDLDRIEARKPSGNDFAINMIFVAFFEFWHGADRLISGLNDYYQNSGARNIHINLVGDGGEIPALKKTVEQLGLTDRVTFHGSMTPDQIDGIYDQCQLAVSTLGMHRIDPNATSSSLKSREYLAKGIPFIHSSQVDVFIDNPNDFCLELPVSDDPIDFFKVVEHFDRIHEQKTEAELIDEIRNYAEETVSMEKAMNAVIEKIKSHGTTH